MTQPNSVQLPREPAEVRYNADIIAGALMVPESRIIADLLLRGVTAEGWTEAIAGQNVLKIRTRDRANRITKLIRGRLETMGPLALSVILAPFGTSLVLASRFSLGQGPLLPSTSLRAVAVSAVAAFAQVEQPLAGAASPLS